MEQPYICNHDTDSWSYYESTAVEISTASGEELNLSICADENCITAVPHTDMGVDVYMNDILLVETRQVEESWSLNHVCP